MYKRQCSNEHLKLKEPFKSLEAGLPVPPPQPSGHHHHNFTGPSRRELLQNGTGLLLRDIVTIQKKLGTCKCKGRVLAEKSRMTQEEIAEAEAEE